MRKISLSKKLQNAVLIIVGGLVLLCTLFLVLISMIFYGENSAPGIFGHNVYLVKTDAFSLINNGTALFARSVPFEEISAGNIVIFLNENDENTIGEIREVMSGDGVYTFRTRLSDNTETVVGQSRIVGKGIYISDAIGGLIGFAVSPAGVCVIAVLPCTLVIVLEILNIIKDRRLRREEERQKEKRDAPVSVPAANAPAAQERDFSALRPVSPAPRRQYSPDETGLFQPPKAAQPVRKPAQPAQKAPISGKELDKLIRETKAEHLQREMAAQTAAPIQQAAPARQSSPVQRERAIGDIQQRRAVRAYTEAAEAAADSEKTDTITLHKAPPSAELEPRRYAAEKTPADDSKISPLDRLLQEDDGDEHYDIDDILRSLEKR